MRATVDSGRLTDLFCWELEPGEACWRRVHRFGATGVSVTYLTLIGVRDLTEFDLRARANQIDLQVHPCGRQHLLVRRVER